MKFNFTKIAKIAGAALASSLLAAALIIPAGAQEATPVSLTYNADNTAETSTGSILLTDVSDVVKAALPAVVSITSRTIYNNYNNMRGFGYNPDEIYEYFFGDSYGGSSDDSTDNKDQQEEAAEDDHSNEVDSGIGSGTIISIDDNEVLILTSYHVVENCSSLYATFNNGTNVDGYIKSAITDKDLAIVGIATEDIDAETLASLKVIPIAAEAPEVGDGVIVIGNALGYGISVTTGIISAADRQITVDGKTLTVLQTDAAINSGNSGGCMLNSNGEIIGISEAKVSSNNVEGMCYAIPVVSNIEYIEKLANNEGTYESDIVIDNGGFLGIKGQSVSTDASASYGMPAGVYVAEVVENGGAFNAGIKKGDIITAIDGEEVKTISELQNKIVEHFPGDTITITLSRASEGEYISQDIEATITEKLEQDEEE